MEAPQNLEEANQQIHWKRVCIKGTFVRAIHMLDGFRELDSLLSFNHPGVSAHPDRDSRLATIQRELVALQERAGQIVEEASSRNSSRRLYLLLKNIEIEIWGHNT